MTSGRANHSSLVQMWAAGRVTVGAACKIPNAFAAESVAAAGFDYVYVDQQHGVFDSGSLLDTMQVIAAAGAAPVTRVPTNRPDLIAQALDYGAEGIIVPLVETELDASKAVRACRYPPEGDRSYGVLRAHLRRGAGTSDSPLEERAACIVLVETEKGVSNLDAIAQTDGVDAIMVGPQDLALSLGIRLRGDWLRTPQLTEAIEQIRVACQDNSIVAGIGASSGNDAAGWLSQGFQMVNIGNDLAYVQTSLRRQLELARGHGPIPT